MRKYHVAHKGEGSEVTLIRREFGVDTKLAVFYPEMGYDLARAISDLIAAGLEAGRQDIFIVQVPSSHAKTFDIRLMADRVSSAEGTELAVSFYRKGEKGEDCIAHVLSGVTSQGVPRVRIKSTGPDGNKRYLEISLAPKEEVKPVDRLSDTGPIEVPVTPQAEAKVETKIEAKVAETPAALPAEAPAAAPSGT
jgi:hypothetical protein